MDINSIPDAFESRVRLAILSALLSGEKDFNDLKVITRATDGNLSTHLSKLENTEYISSSKQFVGKKPKTTFAITKIGRAKFQEYVNLLEEIISTPKD